MGVREHAARVCAFEQGSGFFVRGRHHHPPVFKGPASLLERKGHIGQRLFRVNPQVGSQRLGVGINRGA